MIYAGFLRIEVTGKSSLPSRTGHDLMYVGGKGARAFSLNGGKFDPRSAPLSLVRVFNFYNNDLHDNLHWETHVEA